MSTTPTYPNTFVFGTEDGDLYIECRHCNRRSFNPHDIQQHYCGFCHMHHDDIYPPARQWWIDHKHVRALHRP